jgi:hypothetical protein
VFLSALLFSFLPLLFIISSLLHPFNLVPFHFSFSLNFPPPPSWCSYLPCLSPSPSPLTLLPFPLTSCEHTNTHKPPKGCRNTRSDRSYNSLIPVWSSFTRYDPLLRILPDRKVFCKSSTLFSIIHHIVYNCIDMLWSDLIWLVMMRKFVVVKAWRAQVRDPMTWTNFFQFT